MTTATKILQVLSGRWCVDLALVLCAFGTPWWFTLLCASLFLFVFDGFVELLFLALLLDLLYGNSRAYFFGSTFALSLGAVPLYGLLSAVRRRMRF